MRTRRSKTLAAAATVLGLLGASDPALASWFQFDKYRTTAQWTGSNEVNGFLYGRDNAGTVVISQWGGSGKGTSRFNECISDNGWLPNGWYNSPGQQDNANSVIKGRRIQLDDKYCYNGSVKRWGLFIHSEETSTQGQAAGNCGSPDEAYKWDAFYDFRSEGCIKVAHHTDCAPAGHDGIGWAHWFYHAYMNSGHGWVGNLLWVGGPYN